MSYPTPSAMVLDYLRASLYVLTTDEDATNIEELRDERDMLWERLNQDEKDLANIITDKVFVGPLLVD